MHSHKAEDVRYLTSGLAQARPRQLLLRRLKAPTLGALPPASLQSCASLRPRHTVHPVMCRAKLKHAAPAHPCARGIPFILNIIACGCYIGNWFALDLGL